MTQEEIQSQFENLTPEQKQEILNNQTNIMIRRDTILDSVKDLSIEERGILLTLMLQEVVLEVIPDGDTGEIVDINKCNRVVKSAYRPLSKSLRMNNDIYIKRVLTNRANGRNGGRPPKETE